MAVVLMTASGARARLAYISSVSDAATGSRGSRKWALLEEARVRYLGSTDCMARCDLFQASIRAARFGASANLLFDHSATHVTRRPHSSLSVTARSSPVEQEWSPPMAG